jgi:hypothetical protein
MDTLETENKLLRQQLDLVPASRRRMMGRTVLHSYERDLYKALCEKVAPERVTGIKELVRRFAQANDLLYVLDKFGDKNL